MSFLSNTRALRYGTSIFKTPLTMVAKKTCFEQCWLTKERFWYLIVDVDFEFGFEMKQEMV